MPELLTMQDLSNGHLDVKSMAEAVNGGDTRDVVTRLGTTYPSLAKAIKIILSQGTINATVYKTSALMTASALPDNSYALVTDDNVGNKNGYYQKRAGVWEYLKYNPIAVSRMNIDEAINTLLSGHQQKPLVLKPISDGIVNGTTPQSFIIITGGGVARSYLRIDVSKTKGFTVSNSIGNSQWYWVFTDETGNYISKNTSAVNGYFAVPDNAKWAYRTFQALDLDAKESPSMTIVKTLKPILKDYIEADLSNALNESKKYTNAKLYGDLNAKIQLTPIYGFAADTTPTRPGFLTPAQTGDKRAYITFDVTEYASIDVKNALSVPSWLWVFATKDGAKILSNSTANGRVIVPDNAVTAYKTVYYEKGSEILNEIANGLEITVQYKLPPILPLVENLESRTASLEGGNGGDKYLSGSLTDNVYDMQYLWSKGNLISPNDFEGANQMERIRSAIDFTQVQGFGIVELGYDTVDDTNTWMLTEAILLPSNCWIYINNSTVKQAPNVFDNMFRNAGIVPSPNPYEGATALNQNENIRIFGNDKTKSRIEGNLYQPFTAPHPVDGGAPIPWLGDYFGWRGIKMIFANTKNYRVYNLTISQVTSWSISNEHGCSNFKYHDIVFDNNVKNGDGINMRMGCSDFEVFNISGKTSDDMVAINTINDFILQHPSSPYIYPMQVGGYSERGLGKDISNGKVWNIKGDGSNAGVLLLYGGGGKVWDINISDVSDTDKPFLYYAVRIGNTGVYGAQPVMGDGKDITVRNISSKLVNGSVLELLAPMQDSWINNVKRDSVSSQPTIKQGINYSVQNVKVTNIK